MYIYEPVKTKSCLSSKDLLSQENFKLTEMCLFFKELCFKQIGLNKIFCSIKILYWD